MKAKRGNTMLFPWETERLINLIRAENQGRALNGNNFSFDPKNYIIIQGERTINQYMGNPINLDWEDVKKSEKHFQAFILQNLQIENNNFILKFLERILFGLEMKFLLALECKK
jgi:hypothetical protein